MKCKCVCVCVCYIVMFKWWINVVFVFFGAHRPAQSVKVMIAIAIFLTYSLQFYVPMNIVWSNIRANFSEKNLTLAEYTTRFSLIVSWQFHEECQDNHSFIIISLLSADIYCCISNCDSDNRSIHVTNWSNLRQHIGFHLSGHYWNHHILRSTRFRISELDFVQRHFPDSFRYSWFLLRNVCKHCWDSWNTRITVIVSVNVFFSLILLFFDFRLISISLFGFPWVYTQLIEFPVVYLKKKTKKTRIFLCDKYYIVITI